MQLLYILYIYIARGRKFNAGGYYLNQNLTCYDVDNALLHKVIIHTTSLGDLNLIIASISPSIIIQDVQEFHADMPSPRLHFGFV